VATVIEQVRRRSAIGGFISAEAVARGRRPVSGSVALIRAGSEQQPGGLPGGKKNADIVHPGPGLAIVGSVAVSNFSRLSEAGRGRPGSDASVLQQTDVASNCGRVRGSPCPASPQEGLESPRPAPSQAQRGHRFESGVQMKAMAVWNLCRKSFWIRAPPHHVYTANSLCWALLG